MKKTDVLAYFGSATKTAVALNISDAAISKWGDVIPRARAMEIALFTEGKLKYVKSHYYETVTERKKVLKKRG